MLTYELIILHGSMDFPEDPNLGLALKTYQEKKKVIRLRYNSYIINEKHT